MKKIYLLPALILLNLAAVYAQNGTRLIGFDAVTSGRGGTALATFDNPSLMMNNPAGLAFLKNAQADISISLMAPTVHYKNSINNTDGKSNIFPLGCISYAAKPTGNFTWGAGIFTQGGMGADFNLNHALYVNNSGAYVQQPYHSKFAVMQGGGSVAYKLSNTLSVGVTADLIYGQVEFKMPMSMPTSMMAGILDPSKHITYGDVFAAPATSGGFGYNEVVASADVQKLTALSFNGKIGIAFKPSEKFSAGINYTLPVNLTYKNGKTYMDMTYQMNNAFGKAVGMIMQQNPEMSAEEAQGAAMQMFAGMGIDFSKGVKDVYNAQAKFGLPQSLAAGIFFAPAKKLRLSLDAEWINWKKAFDQMDITLTGGTNANINKMLGTNGTIEMAFPMYWKNTVVVRTGIEGDVSKTWTLRAGYVYGSNPVPTSTVFPVFPAVVKHHATAGFSVKVSKAIVINAAYEHAFNSDLKADAQSYVGAQYNGSTSSLSNNIYHASVSWLLK